MALFLGAPCTRATSGAHVAHEVLLSSLLALGLLLPRLAPTLSLAVSPPLHSPWPLPVVPLAPGHPPCSPFSLRSTTRFVFRLHRLLAILACQPVIETHSLFRLLNRLAFVL